VKEYLEIGSGESIESENLMEFRLLYQGELFATSRNDTRAKHKHALRRSFHLQLRRLWGLNANLREYVLRKSLQSFPEGHTNEERFNLGIQAIGKEWSRAGYDLVPLVLPEFALRCSLDILLLRPEDDTFIFERGDIDGQIKTLFDALRIPDHVSETGGSAPDADEKPLFCLLQNDKLISEVRVTADQMLLLPGTREPKANDAFVVIYVKLNHKTARTFDNYFG
jgi:hypothetical protein